jgi:hypothetical protein
MILGDKPLIFRWFYHIDLMVLYMISSAIPANMIDTLAVKPTVKDAWGCIKTMRISNDRVRKVTLKKVQREYELLSFCDEESMEDFARRLNSHNT